jgi:hypothetical protein
LYKRTISGALSQDVGGGGGCCWKRRKRADKPEGPWPWRERPPIFHRMAAAPVWGTGKSDCGRLKDKEHKREKNSRVAIEMKYAVNGLRLNSTSKEVHDSHSTMTTLIMLYIFKSMKHSAVPLKEILLGLLTTPERSPGRCVWGIKSISSFAAELGGEVIILIHVGFSL